MSIFNNNALSVETRIELIKKAYRALNYEYAANAFDDVAEDLIKALSSEAASNEAPSQELTLRDQFAMSAMNGLLSNSGGVIQANSHTGTGWVNTSAKGTAELAYEIADVMLKAREVKQ